MQAHKILKRDIGDLSADTRAVAKDIRDVLADVGGLADERLDAVRQVAEQRIRKALAQVEDLQGRFEKRVGQSAALADRQASDHPWQLAAAASLAGAAIGLTLGLVLRQGSAHDGS